MVMKLPTLPRLAALACMLFVAPTMVNATVVVYSGTEQQREHHYTNGMGHSSNGMSVATGRVFFLVELETGRSIEIRLVQSHYLVRQERNMLIVTASRGGSVTSTQKFPMDSSLTHVHQNATASSRLTNSITWNGTKFLSYSQPNPEPATGLPSNFPTALVGRQDRATLALGDEGGGGMRRRTHVVSLVPALTKSSNAADDNFEAALQRLKSHLESRGKTEVDDWGQLGD